jgi:hypothetical protein
MAERRILIEADGDVRLPVVPDPLLSSGATTWEGFLLEQHYMPPVLEFPAHMRFPGHIIAVTLCDEPPTTYWRENGRERNARLFNGRIAMTSQEIYASHQIGASIAQALLIHDSTME